jgi:hypothetical protein
VARLLIVNDRRTLVERLAPDLGRVGHEVVGHCWRARQVLPAAEAAHDVVLVNLDLPSDINAAPLVGFALTEALLERDPNERVLFYADVEGQEYVDRARRVGLWATCRSPSGCTSSRWPSRSWRQAGSSGWDDLLHLTGRRRSRSAEPGVHGHVPTCPVVAFGSWNKSWRVDARSPARSQGGATDRGAGATTPRVSPAGCEGGCVSTP